MYGVRTSWPFLQLLERGERGDEAFFVGNLAVKCRLHARTIVGGGATGKLVAL